MLVRSYVFPSNSVPLRTTLITPSFSYRLKSPSHVRYSPPCSRHTYAKRPAHSCSQGHPSQHRLQAQNSQLQKKQPKQLLHFPSAPVVLSSASGALRAWWRGNGLDYLFRSGAHILVSSCFLGGPLSMSAWTLELWNLSWAKWSHLKITRFASNVEIDEGHWTYRQGIGVIPHDVDSRFLAQKFLR